MKIIVREDGTKISISVAIWQDFNEVKYRYRLEVCPKGKRKYINPIDTNSYSYRALSMPERKANRLEQMLKYVTKEELLEAALELWERQKPTLNNLETL